MGLTITNEDVLRMIGELAERRGVSPEEALREAVERAAERDAETVRKVAALRRIQAEIAALPVLDPRTPDELVGYDETGLPA